MTNTISKRFWLIFGLLFWATASNALLVKLSDMHTMAKRSDLIVHGYVGDQKVVTDKLGRLITLTDVEVIDGLYGAKTGEIITVYQVGGKKDGIVMPLMGGQKYDVGQEIFFFGLKLENTFVSYGAGQGKLDVHREGGQDFVVEDLGNVGSITHAIRGGAVTQPSPLMFPSTELFKEEVRLMIQTR